MEHVIFKDQNSNMAGSEWKTLIWLRRTRRNGYSLHAKVISYDEYPTTRMPARRNLRSATEIYEAVVAALEWTQIEPDENLIRGIAHEIATFDGDLAKDFVLAPTIVEALEEEEAERRTAERTAALAPFLKDIERLCPLPNNPGARVGAGLTEGNVHGMKKRQLEDFILRHGHLPEDG